MKCRKCGSALTPGAKFCKFCGKPVEQNDDRERNSRRVVCPGCGAEVREGKRFCTTCGFDLSLSKAQSAQPERFNPEPVEKKRRGPVIFLVVSLIVIILLIAAVGAYLWMNQDIEDKPSEESKISAEETVDTSWQDDQEESDSEEDSTAGDQEEGDATEEDKKLSADSNSSTGNATGAAGNQNGTGDSYNAGVIDESSAAEIAVDRYQQAYIKDIQTGGYTELYAAVELGSKMEETQKKFIKDCNLYEELYDSIPCGSTRIDAKTYHVTVIEEYYVLSYESGTEYILKQKCTYKVCKQADGTWKVADYVGIVEQLEKNVL